MRWSADDVPGRRRASSAWPTAAGRARRRVGRDLRLPAGLRRPSGQRSTCSPTPAARGAGAILAAVSERARAAGKSPLHVPASTTGPTASSSSSTAASASTSASRPSSSSSPGRAAAVEPPAGVSLTTLAERPELVEGVHAVGGRGFADIPGGETPMAAGDLEEFRVRDVDRPSIPRARLLRSPSRMRRAGSSATPT